MQTISISPGLTFMLATVNGMPRTLGDRARISAINEAMALAIKCRMKFDKDDVVALSRLDISTSVGVFRAFDAYFYSAACSHGGSYPALWEKAHLIKPWKAPTALKRDTREIVANRIAPGHPVLLPIDQDAASKKEEEYLAIFHGLPLWWCTSLNADHIILCRYNTHPTGSHWMKDGLSPRKRLKLGRKQWEALFQSFEATKAA